MLPMVMSMDLFVSMLLGFLSLTIQVHGQTPQDKSGTLAISFLNDFLFFLRCSVRFIVLDRLSDRYEMA